MQSLKCPQCNLVNFAGSTKCKRCDSDLSQNTSQTIPITSLKNSPTKNNNLPKIILGVFSVILAIVLVSALVFPTKPKTENQQSLISSVMPKREVTLKGDVFIVTQGRDNVKLGAETITIMPLEPVLAHIAQRNVDPTANTRDFSWYALGLPVADSITAYTDADGKFSVKIPSGKYAIMAMSNRKVYDKTEFYHWLIKVDAEQDENQVLISNGNMTDSGSPQSLLQLNE